MIPPCLGMRTTERAGKISPEVDEIDLSAWMGGVGETLRARARDDACLPVCRCTCTGRRRQVQVEGVHFLIATEDGTLVEAGAGTPEGGGLWWRYETTVDHPGLPACLQVYLHRQTQAGGPAKVVVTARDGSTGSPQACPATRAAWRRGKR